MLVDCKWHCFKKKNLVSLALHNLLEIPRERAMESILRFVLNRFLFLVFIISKTQFCINEFSSLGYCHRCLLNACHRAVSTWKTASTKGCFQSMTSMCCAIFCGLTVWIQTPLVGVTLLNVTKFLSYFAIKYFVHIIAYVAFWVGGFFFFF